MPPRGLVQVAAGGSRLETLRELRDTLTRQIVEAEGTAAASLARVLVHVLAEIDELAPPNVARGTVLDEVRARREGRGAPAGATGAARVGKRG